MSQAMLSPAPTQSNHAQRIVDALRREGWTESALSGNGKLREHFRKLEILTLIQLVELVEAQGHGELAPSFYARWIEVNGAHPHRYVAHFNMGIQRGSQGDRQGAVSAYQDALALKPDLYQAAVNLGLQFEAMGRVDEALEIWRKAVDSTADDGRTALYNHLGRVLENRKRYDEADEALSTSLRIDPDQPNVIHHWVHLRQKMCAWPVYAEIIPGLFKEALLRNTGALAALAVVDDIGEQTRFAQEWLQKWLPPAPAQRLSPVQGYSHRRIRLGYMSSDYCMHPMSFLVAELFEKHDRSQFELYGYCTSPEDGSPVRQRIKSSFDHFTLIRDLSDEDAAQKIRDDEIDILIELNGISMGSRLAVLRARPAPVQLTYLGFIGPVPMEELDYMLCDDYVIPPDRADAYQPRPLYLPELYQVNDTKLPVGPKASRAEIGLPEDRFVFCSFSNNYKITEEIFGAWMDILKRCDNAVLWLLADNDAARRNMLARAAEHGVDSSRFYFADRVSPPTYLARLALADLFLDTFPYNAGTTASDALRMGLPLVTLSGQSFVSRMAGSLLRAIGFEYGIADSLTGYIDKAVALANDPALYYASRTKIGGDAWRRTIGNIETFVPRLEAAYQRIVKRG